MKSLNQNLQKVIRVLKDSGNTLNDITNKQLSDLSGVNTKYILRNKILIEEYFAIATPSSEDDYNFASNRSIKIYIDIAFKIDTKYKFRAILGAIIGFLLKWKYKLLKHIHKPSKIIEIGINIMEIICLVYSRKDTTKGTPIHSQSKAVKQLFRGNKVAFIDELFKRTDGYYAGNNAKKWQLTKLSELLVLETIDIVFIDMNVCLDYCSTFATICRTKRETQHIALDIDIVRTLSLSSILHILNLSIGYNQTNNQLLVSIAHTSKTDESLGRTYNLFCRLRSEERIKFGYISYDINSALQTICLQLIKGTKDNYPILTSYSTDSVYKQALRATIANDLNITIDEVKAKLTAFANGGISGKDNHPIYEQFQEESDKLRREVLVFTANNNPWLLEQSIQQSKRYLPEDIDWYNLEPEDSQTLARNKSSVFFFIWTYYERLIRKAMLECFTDGIEVHDAVYSKMSVDTNFIEQNIFSLTNFIVIIESA